MWKWLVGTFIVLAVGCGVGGYFAYHSDAVQAQIKLLRGGETAIKVKIEPASRGPLTRTVGVPGTLVPKVRAEIRAQVSAKITALPFKKGQDVQKGDVIVRLDAEELTAALDSARAGLRADEARLEGTQAALAEARSDLDRVERLHGSKDRSVADLEASRARFLQAQSSLQAVQAAVESARANVKRAERDLSNTVIAAPIGGTIVELNNVEGELVLGTFNNLGQTIMVIVELGSMVMNAEVDEANVALVRAGQAAKVHVNGFQDTVFEGVVDLVVPQSATSREGKQYFAAEIGLRLKEGQRLMSGMKSNADIAVETFTDVLRVPTQAVLDRKIDELPAESAKAARALGEGRGRDKSFARVVYRVVDGKSLATPVTTGTSDLTQTIVLAGLSEADRVITGPFKVLAALREGQLVEDVDAPVAKPADGTPDDGSKEGGVEVETAAQSGADGKGEAKAPAGSGS